MITVDTNLCIGCGLCEKDCLRKIIRVTDSKAAVTQECFRCGHCIAVCPVGAISTTDDDEYAMTDVVEVRDGETTIPGEQMLRVIKCRRSIRQFKKRPVECEKLEMIIEAGRFSPTGSNRQSTRYIVIQNTMEDFNRTAMECLRSYDSEERFPLLFKDPATRARIGFSDDHFLFKGAPCVVLLVSPGDINAINAGIAATSMELTANGLNVGMLHVGYFTYLCNTDASMREYLGLAENERLGATLAFGYPDVTYLRSVPRKPARITWR